MPGMIVAPQPMAVEEGAKVLVAGGNAFDAAVAAAVVQGVTDPHSCGLGGYLVMTYHRAGQTSPSPILDAPAIAGSLVKPEMWKDAILRSNPDGWGYFLKDKVNDNGMSVSDAVLAPRFDCQGDTIKCQARIPELVCSEVRKHHAIERASKSHGGFALVHAIACDPQTCRLTGAADTGGEGMPLLVN